MKTTKMAFLAGAALTLSAAGARADGLEALKAQIELLNARLAAMETAPALPSRASLLTVSEAGLRQVPGLGMSPRELMAYGKTSTVISVLPMSDDDGATISFSGYTRAALWYENVSSRDRARFVGPFGSGVVLDSESSEHIDVRARGQIRVEAMAETAAGDVGVDIRLRGIFNGVDTVADLNAVVAWGYWAMTPELTLGGGYAGSLGNIGFGYDGACSCEYTSNADLHFNPDDTTQLRLSYVSGPVAFGVALEDGSIAGEDGEPDGVHGGKLGAAGEIRYSGDAVSAEVSAVWRDLDDAAFEFGAGALWQAGAGIGFILGGDARVSFAAAMGEDNFRGFGNDWWGVSALASVNLSEEVFAELGAGYKTRDFVPFTGTTMLGDYTAGNGEHETYGVLGGLYYAPVDQFTLGVEAEWYTASLSRLQDYGDGAVVEVIDLETRTETYSVNLVTVWRF